jgi:hypothetical protein
MPNTFTLLEQITVGAAGASSVTFNSIPQTGYTDLVIKMSVRCTANVDYGSMTLNGLSTNFSSRKVYGDGVSALSTSRTDNLVVGLFNPSGSTANTFSTIEAYFPNYTSSNYKSFSLDSAIESNSASSGAGVANLAAYLWSNTAAINAVSFSPNSGNFTQYSTFSLYGVSALGVTPTKAPKATGGDIIMTDGTYWIHTFLSSGTFKPATGLTCDYLVVAGGASGGSNKGAGGGAGGLRSTVTATGGGGSLESALSLSSGTSYTVTVGAGGARNLSSNGSNGSNSVFSTITSTGGGFGGSNQGTANGATGGSGGGGGGGATSTGGSGTANQGFAGGNGVAGTYDSGGGGGGASAVGQPGVNTLLDGGGNGGNGVATSITGSSVTYGGGGGGGDSFGTGFGLGGTGGGGNGGGPSTAGSSATANTGGGGGGAGDNSTSAGNGGSGIVIVRYLA